MSSAASKALPALFFFLISLNAVSAYTFQENPAVPDSVRLSLNTEKSVNGTVALDVLAYQVTNIYSTAFDVEYNSSVLEWVGKFTHDPDGYERGTFFGSSAIYEIGHQIEVNGSANKNKLVVGAIGNPLSPKTGSGSIMTVKFMVVGTGTTAVYFSNNNLIKPDLNFTSSTWYGGTFISEEAIPTIPQDDPPVVFLITPDQSAFSTGNIILICSASDDYSLVNLTLYTNVTGSWQPYQTVIPADTVWIEGFSVTNLQSRTYKWNCRAADSKGQETWAQVEFLFSVQLPADPNPPQRSNGQPSGNLAYTDVTISLTTDEPATCRYANIPELSYGAMIYNFTNTGGTSHSMSLSLIANYPYHYYVKCNDTTGNANTDDYVIAFSIGNVMQDTQPPVIANDMVTGLLAWDTSYADLAVKTDENALCKYAPQGGMVFGSMQAFATTYFRNHSSLVTGLHEGKHYDYYVKCSDSSGNTNPSDIQISFYVCYEADLSCDRTVSMNELDAYIDRWHYNSSDVTLARLIKAISLWKYGVG